MHRITRELLVPLLVAVAIGVGARLASPTISPCATLMLIGTVLTVVLFYRATKP